MSELATAKRDPEDREGRSSLPGRDNLVALEYLIQYKIKGQPPPVPSPPSIKESLHTAF